MTPIPDHLEPLRQLSARIRSRASQPASSGVSANEGMPSEQQLTPMQQLRGAIPAEESDVEFETACASLREAASPSRLSEAVRPYLQHKFFCKARWNDHSPSDKPCDCGLEDVLTLLHRPHPTTTVTLPDAVSVKMLETEVAVLQRKVDDCQPYLKDGETPAQCLARNRADIVSLMGQLAAAKLKSEGDASPDERFLNHYWTPDPTQRFCVVCGDNALGSVWGVHRFQIQPGDPDFKGDATRSASPRPPPVRGEAMNYEALRIALNGAALTDWTLQEIQKATDWNDALYGDIIYERVVRAAHAGRQALTLLKGSHSPATGGAPPEPEVIPMQLPTHVRDCKKCRIENGAWYPCKKHRVLPARQPAGEQP